MKNAFKVWAKSQGYKSKAIKDVLGGEHCRRTPDALRVAYYAFEAGYRVGRNEGVESVHAGRGHLGPFGR